MTALMSKMRGGGDSPAGEVDLASPGAERRRVRVRQLAAGTFLVVLASLVGFLAFQARGETVEVWVAGSGLDPGAVIEPTDLFREIVDVDSQLGALDTSVGLAGRTVRVGVPAGATITTGHLFGPGESFAGSDLARVGLVFKAGQAPEGILVDDLLRLILSTNSSEVEQTLEDVPVLAVSAAGGSGRLITVELPLDVVDEFVLAASRGDVFASVVGRR